MTEQAPVIDPVQEQGQNNEHVNGEQQAARVLLAAALYNSFISNEGQSDGQLEHPMVADDETAHRELLSQLQSVNGTVPKHLQLKRDWDKSQKEHLEAQKSHHSEVMSSVEDRLKMNDELQRFKGANEEQERKTTAHNEKLARRDSEADGRSAARDAYISRMKTARGLKATNVELESEADAYVAEIFGPAKHAKEGVADTAELKTEGPTASQQKNTETGEAWRNFHRGFAKQKPEGVIEDLLVDDKDVPEFDPENLKEQRFDWEDSTFPEWEVDPEEFFAEDDQPTQELVVLKGRRDERPVDAATREFTENSRQSREQNSARKRIRNLMGRAHDMLNDASARGAVKAMSGFEKVQAYFNNDEKKTRRVAAAGVVLGAVAGYAAARLTLVGDAPSGSGSGSGENALLPFLPFGGSGAKEQLVSHAAQTHSVGHHVVSHAVQAGNEVTLKPNIHGGDSIWHEEYSQAHKLHPNWNEHQLNNWANEHTRHLMEVNNMTEAEAEKLKAGTTVKG